MLIQNPSSLNHVAEVMMNFDKDSFYLCQETSPRCFVVHKAIQVDRSQMERVKKDLNEGRSEGDPIIGHNGICPPAPPIPSWFNDECRQKLISGEGGLLQSSSANSTATTIVSSDPTPTLLTIPTPVACEIAVGPPVNVNNQRHENMKALLKAQLEYYFSRENLVSDRYLRCQMDQDNFVPISIIAGFRKVVAITNDYDFIVQTLRESRKVEVDEKGEKVRAISQRCTLILREMELTQEEEVKNMLAGGPPYLSLVYGINQTWYIQYNSEETTKQAYLHLQQLGKSICARIKTGPPPDQQLYVQPPPPVDEGPQIQATQLVDLGKTLAAMGFYPYSKYIAEKNVCEVVESRDNLHLSSHTPSHPSPSPSSIFDFTLHNGSIQTNTNGYPRNNKGGRGGQQRNGGGSSLNRGGRGGNGTSRTHSNSFGSSNGSVVLQQQIQGNTLTPNYQSNTNTNSDRRYRNDGGGGRGRYHEGRRGGGESSRREDGGNGSSTIQSPPPPPPPVTFNYNEELFPSLVDDLPVEPKKEKLSFSSVAAGRKEEKSKKSYAQSLRS